MFFKKFTQLEKTLFISYILLILGLFLYSFTQIDLSLTFSRITFLRNIVTSFQYIGYFNRPLSALLFILIIFALLIFYLLFLYYARKKKISSSFFWITVITVTAIVTFAYNAFSYDIFNYIFDAKIITHYQQNPYIHKALDYPGDPMLSFMRWTHRVYPYGPVWLVFTVPLSLLGFGFFIPTFLLFKLLMAVSYLGSLYYLSKILQRIKPSKEIIGLTFFAFNPLVIIECLVSAHLDIVMIFISLWSFYQLVKKKCTSSFFLLFVSIGIKFATGFLLPVYFYICIAQKNKKQIHWNFAFIFSTILLLITVFAASTRTNFQPWYLVLPLAYAALTTEYFAIVIPCLIISFFALFTYLPFLYTGNWDPPIPTLLLYIYLSSYIISILGIVLAIMVKKQQLRNTNNK